VLRAVQPIRDEDVVLGQYEGYKDDPTVPKDSVTPTFASIILHINNERWDGRMQPCSDCSSFVVFQQKKLQGIFTLLGSFIQMEFWYWTVVKTICLLAAGVPFIMKAGKALDSRKAEIRVQFKDVPGDIFKCQKQGRNEFVMRLQPSEAMYMKLTVYNLTYSFSNRVSPLLGISS
jgi:glucose-6-phosphate 1-dehydrogenase